MNRAEMDRTCAGATTKSDKIRRLWDGGAEKSDIARYLGVRYQFVYNVIKAAAGGERFAEPQPGERQEERLDEEGPLTIAEAKRRLALSFGVDPSAIRITVEG